MRSREAIGDTEVQPASTKLYLTATKYKWRTAVTIREKVARALVKARGATWTGATYYAADRSQVMSEADAALAALPCSVEQLEQIAKGEVWLTQTVNVSVTTGGRERG